MADNDLEIDGAPVSKQNYFRYGVAERFSKQDKLGTDNSREDSGIYSLGDSYRSCSSYKYGNSSSDNVAHLSNDFNGMAIGDPSCTKTINDPNDDEGFYSKSINDSETVYDCVQTQTLTPTSDAVDAYTQDDDGDTPLHMAIIQLFQNIAIQMVNLAPHFHWLDLVNNLLQTPLHLAVVTRQALVVRRLMVGGASLDSRDQHGNTPLHIAAREGIHSITSLLLTQVTQEEATENTYHTLLQEIQDLEAKNYDGHSALHLAALGTHLDVMRELLLRGAKINAQDGKSGRTILHYAAETGNLILLRFIINQKGVDIDSCTYGGLTPIVLAAGRKYGDVVEILRRHGADTTRLLVEIEDDEEMIDDFCLNGRPLS